MKFLLFFIANLCLLSAQDFLKVEYEVYDKIELKEDLKDEFSKMLIQNNNKVHHYQLLISGDESFFSKIEKIDNNQDRAMMSFSTIDRDIYMNTITNETKRGIDYNGTNFLIVEPLKIYDWKLTRETKTILGQEVKKATFKTKDGEMIAWYAPKLPYKIGPIYFNGLPGLILSLTYSSENESETSTQIFNAVSID